MSWVVKSPGKGANQSFVSNTGVDQSFIGNTPPDLRTPECHTMIGTAGRVELVTHTDMVKYHIY